MIRFVILAALALLAARDTCAQASFEEIRPFDGPYNTANSLSADGIAIVGEASPTADVANDGRAYRWLEGGSVSTIAVLNGFNSMVATGVSSGGGVVVGNAFPRVGALTAGFAWTESDGTQALGARSANDVSADGAVIIGRTDDAQAFRRTEADGIQTLAPLPDDNLYATALGVSADGSVIVGIMSGATSAGQDAFLWTEAEGVQALGYLPGRSRSRAYGVSPDGTVVVGDSYSFMGTTEAFRWEAGTMLGLGVPPGGTDSGAGAVSNEGTVIAGSALRFSTNRREGTLWTQGRGLQWLRDAFEQDYGFDLSAWREITVTDVSANGLVLAGSGRFLDGTRGAWRAVLVGTDIIVNSTGDEPNDSVSLSEDTCDVDRDMVGDQCTLRAAIELANQREGATIEFNIEGPGIPRIQVTEYEPISNPTPLGVQSLGLPEFTAPIVLDGTTQPGGWVELIGTGVRNSDSGVSADALRIVAGGEDSEVRGMVIHSFKGSLIRTFPGADGCRIEGNRLGTDVAGTQARGTPGFMRWGGLTYDWEDGGEANGAAYANLRLASDGNTVVQNVIGGNSHCSSSGSRHSGVDIMTEPLTTGNVLIANSIGVSEAGDVIDSYSDGDCEALSSQLYAGALIFGGGHLIGNLEGGGNAFGGHLINAMVREQNHQILGNQFGIRTLPEPLRQFVSGGLYVGSVEPDGQRGTIASNSFWSEGRALRLGDGWDVLDNDIVGGQSHRNEPFLQGDSDFAQRYAVSLGSDIQFRRNEVEANGWAIGVLGSNNQISDTQIGEGFGGVYVRESGSVLISETTSESRYMAVQLDEDEIVNELDGFPEVSLNDITDLDDGGNGMLNYPRIVRATRSGASFEVEGFLEGAFSGAYAVEVYANRTCTNVTAYGRPYGGGQAYIGRFTVEPQTGDIGEPRFSIQGTGISPEYRFLSLTSSRPDLFATSEFSDCVSIVPDDQTAQEEVDPDQTGIVLEALDTLIAIDSPSGISAPSTAHPGGAVFATRYNAAPDSSVFASGSATASDGSTVVPDAVAPRHWLLAEQGLTNVPTGQTPAPFSVCLAPTDVVLTPDAVVLVVRNQRTEGWVPLNTRTERRGGTDYLCTSGLDALGEFSLGGADGAFPVAAEDDVDIRQEALTVRTFPNPASGAATVEAQMPEASEVHVVIYDALGREVVVLHTGPLAAGTHLFALDAAPLATGVYVLRVSTPEAVVTRRLTVVR